MAQVQPIKTDLSDLNEEQHKAVTSDTKRMLVLAGAYWLVWWRGRWWEGLKWGGGRCMC